MGVLNAKFSELVSGWMALALCPPSWITMSSPANQNLLEAQFVNTIEIISILRGTPITIFLMLCAMGGRAGVTGLASNTGYNRKTISAALERLHTFLLVAKMLRYDGWTVTSRGYELFETVFIPRGVENIPLPPTSSSINNLSDLNKESLTTTSSAENTPPEIYKLLKAGGIGEPKRTELSQMEHVTPEYAEAHLASGEDLPLIIWRMEREFKPPPRRVKIEYFPCQECGRLTTDKICEDCDG